MDGYFEGISPVIRPKKVIGKTKVEKAKNAFEELNESPNIKSSPNTKSNYNDWNFVRNI